MKRFFLYCLVTLSLPLVILSSDEIVSPDSTDKDLSIEECYSKGRQCLAEEEYGQANEWFKKAEELLLKEENQRSLNKELRAEQKQNKVVHKVEQNIIDQAGEAFAENNYDLALEFYQYALESSPENKDIYYNLGVVYLEKKDYEQSARSFLKVLKIDPEDSESNYNLAVLYENHLKDPDKALFYYKKYISLVPQSFDKEKVETWINYLERSVD